MSRYGWLGAVFVFALGIVIGFVLGGVGPRRELSAREHEVARLSRELSRGGGGGWRSPVPGLDRVLREPEGEGSPSLREEGERSTRSREEYGDGGVPPLGWRARWRERAASPDERLQAFQRAVSVQRVRRVQSRAALAQQASLDDRELAQLDEALAQMNNELRGHGEELVLLAMSEEPPSARDLLGITQDVTGILYRAQLRMEEIVGPDRLRNVEPTAVEIWNHVDLSQLEPAARAAVQRLP